MTYHKQNTPVFPTLTVQQYTKLLPSIADAYYKASDQTENEHYNRKVYKYFNTVMHAQYLHITKVLGINVIFTDGQPYDNVHSMIKDVHTRKVLMISTDFNEPNKYMTKNENLRFRAVHDYFGHILGGQYATFSAIGEIRAFITHMQTVFCPFARQVMLSELLAQTSVTFYNKDGSLKYPLNEVPQNAIFEDQKSVVLSSEVLGL